MVRRSLSAIPSADLNASSPQNANAAKCPGKWYRPCVCIRTFHAIGRKDIATKVVKEAISHP
ncbi:MAG: hypothetical protein JWN34_3992 [Bryobacterales bacterium]|jgi:hypothetical protein|nr:hypothetical protein [Bryobacterales bacterium]